MTCDIPVVESVGKELETAVNINLEPTIREEVRRNLKRKQNDEVPGIERNNSEKWKMWKADIELSVTY